MTSRAPQRTASQSSIPGAGSAPHRLSLSAGAAAGGGGANSSSGSLPLVSPSHGLPSLHSGSSSAISSFSVPSHASSSSVVNPTALALSHPHSSLSAPVSHVSYAAFAALTTEMTSTLARTSQKAIRKRRKARREIQRAVWGKEHQADDGGLNPAARGREEAEEEAEQLRRSLEAIGERTGASYAERLSRDRPPFLTTLDVLKFLCKEVWISLFEKQVDNLRTNHRGVYVLQDNAFKMVMRLSAPTALSASLGPKADSANETMRLAKLHLAYPVGLLRGILSRLGVPAVVVAEPTLSSSPAPSLAGPGGNVASNGAQGQGGSTGGGGSTSGQAGGGAHQPLSFVGPITFHVKTGASAQQQAAQPITAAPSEGLGGR